MERVKYDEQERDELLLVPNSYEGSVWWENSLFSSFKVPKTDYIGKWRMVNFVDLCVELYCGYLCYFCMCSCTVRLLEKQRKISVLDCENGYLECNSCFKSQHNFCLHIVNSHRVYSILNVDYVPLSL